MESQNAFATKVGETNLPGKLKIQPGEAEMTETERRGGGNQEIVLGGRTQTFFVNSRLCLRSLRASGLHFRRLDTDTLPTPGRWGTPPSVAVAEEGAENQNGLCVFLPI